MSVKILRLSSYFVPEVVSSNHLTEDLYEGFKNNKIKCVCYAPQPTRGVTEEMHKKYKRYEEFYDGNIIVYRFPMFREGRNPIIRAIRYFLCSIVQYFKGIKEKDIDIVYGTSTPPTQGLLSAIVAKKISKLTGRKIPFIYNLQDIFPDSLVNANLTKKGSVLWKIGRKIENYTYKSADKIIVISESMKENIIKKGVLEEKIEVISNWIDIENVLPIKRSENSLIKKLSLNSDDFIVVYAGNFGAAQGADIIIEVAKKLKKYSRIKFVIFGGGTQFEQVKKEAKNIENIIIKELLPLEYVSQVYSLGNVALITCKKGTGTAGMPSKTWSIMACNTPIIAAFDIESELNNILKKSNAGKCVEAENGQELSNAILEEYEYYLKNGIRKINSRNFVKQYASKEVCVAKYVDIIKNERKKSNEKNL